MTKLQIAIRKICELEAANNELNEKLSEKDFYSQSSAMYCLILLALLVASNFAWLVAFGWLK